MGEQLLFTWLQFAKIVKPNLTDFTGMATGKQDNNHNLNFIDNYMKGGVYSDLSRVIVGSWTGDMKFIKPYLVKATNIIYPIAYVNKYMHLLNLMATVCEEDGNSAFDAITRLERSKYTPEFACYTRECILM